MKSDTEVQTRNIPFEVEVANLLKSFIEFRTWLDKNKKRNIGFMRAYKEKIEKKIGPSIRAFQEKYQGREEGQTFPFDHLMKAFSCFCRPITFMETELRPSVGMGVFLERWMLTKAAESYLKECCQEADRHIDALTESQDLL